MDRERVKSVGTVSTPTWFPNTSAYQHITPDLATLTDSAPYLGNDHLHVGDGKGLSISHIEHTMLHSPTRTFTLSNVLHIPHITKPLLSVQKFYRDNNVCFEFHTYVFYVKDLTTKAVLFSDQSNDSLLPPPFLKLIGLLASLQLLIYGIVDWVILLPIFSIC